MSTLAVVVLGLVVLAVLVALLAGAGRRRAQRLERERAIAARDLQGHRQEADSLGMRVRESAQAAQEHRTRAGRLRKEAEREERQAAELEKRGQRGERFARRHEEEADVAAERLDDLNRR